MAVLISASLEDDVALREGSGLAGDEAVPVTADDGRIDQRTATIVEDACAKLSRSTTLNDAALLCDNGKANMVFTDPSYSCWHSSPIFVMKIASPSGICSRRFNGSRCAGSMGVIWIAGVCRSSPYSMKARLLLLCRKSTSPCRVRPTAS